jgi:hypothetical protein
MLLTTILPVTGENRINLMRASAADRLPAATGRARTDRRYAVN